MNITMNNTSIRYESGMTIVRLHNTDIVKLGNRYIELNSGGYKTVTTKRRMNEVLQADDQPYHVYQENYCWRVRNSLNGKSYSFTDGLTLPRII